MNLSRKCLFFVFFYPNYFSLINLYLNRNWNFQSFFIYFLLSSSLYTVEVEYLFKMRERERERWGSCDDIYPFKSGNGNGETFELTTILTSTTHNTQHTLLSAPKETKPPFFTFHKHTHLPIPILLDCFYSYSMNSFYWSPFFHFFKMGLINYRNKGIGKMENVEVE